MFKERLCSTDSIFFPLRVNFILEALSYPGKQIVKKCEKKEKHWKITHTLDSLIVKLSLVLGYSYDRILIQLEEISTNFY